MAENMQVIAEIREEIRFPTKLMSKLIYSNQVLYIFFTSILVNKNLNIVCTAGHHECESYVHDTQPGAI